MLQVRVTPLGAHERVAASAARRRLAGAGEAELAGRGADLLAAVIAVARAAGAGAVELAVTDARAVHAAMAAANGLVLRREILRVGRPLPVGEPWDVAVRPFRVGHDEDAWLAVNNRAFAWHPDQGGWGRADIEARETEPWFDPAGFLLHERDGHLVAFCWTKVHAEERPPLGEIFVIGVDPDAAGSGLGRAMVLAGLDHLAAQGLRRAILYVESTNTRARALYDRLGFAPEAVDRWWGADLVPSK